MLTWRFMESHQGIRQTRFACHDDPLTGVDSDGHSRFAPWNLYRDNELLFIDQVPDESDFAVDPSLFKRRLERIDERPP